MNQLTFELRYKNPVPVAEFCDALSSLADEYERAKSIGDRPDADAYDLCISRIEEGSIIAYLQEYGPYAIALAEAANASIDFLKNLSDGISWLRTKAGPKPEFDPEQLDNTIRLVTPVARDSGASITISGNTFNGPVTINMNSGEAEVVRDTAKFELESLGRPKLEIKKGVVLRWYQARNDAKSRSGDRAIIDALHPKSVKTVFVSEGLKAQLISADSNPFKLKYVVDVAIEAVGGRPTKYQIFDIHGIAP